MIDREKLESQLETYYNWAKEVKEDSMLKKHLFSQFISTLAMLWLKCDGKCENLQDAEVVELTFIVSLSKAIRLLEDQWVKESLYQLHPEWILDEVFKDVLSFYHKTTGSDLVGAARRASGGK